MLWSLLLGLLLPVVRVLTVESIEPSEDVVSNPLDVLLGECLDYRPRHEWWSYQWCYKDKIEQHHYERYPTVPVVVNAVGTFQGETHTDSESWSQTYQHTVADCEVEESGEKIRRTATAHIKCCIVDWSSNNRKRRFKSDVKHDTFIELVEEISPCNYQLTVCSELTCSEEMKEKVRLQQERSKPRDIKYNVADEKSRKKQKVAVKTEMSPKSDTPTKKLEFQHSFTAEYNNHVTLSEQDELKNKVKEMFYHGYNSYMDNAFPQADLKPLSCTGGAFELIKIPLVTLIDSLDTLVILGNFTEFKRAVKMINRELSSFDFDVNVSVFETTIRVLGGLISSHLMAVDYQLNIYSGNTSDHYDGSLLRLAVDLGNRLLPAFDTATGIPFGTVNLHSGVPKGETELASTAGAGSLVIEFEVLSCLTGDDAFGTAARIATEALFDRRSDLSLVGKHIHVRSGKWHETLSGVGSNSDSFYEYLLKAYLLFRRKDYYIMFQEVFDAVKEHSLQEDVWFNDVDMFSGKVRTRRSESLQAFWPGLEALLGMTRSSSNLLNAFYLVLKDFEFLPEEFDYMQWDIDKKKGSSVYYPLRPELIESTYLHYMATRDRSWLIAGRSFYQAIERHTRTNCGYAAVKDITVMQVEDDMPSYFLSETCKYLYLLFDENNAFHQRNYIFSTEAHPFDTIQLSEVCSSNNHISDYEGGNLIQDSSDVNSDVYSLFNKMMENFERIDEEYAEEYREPEIYFNEPLVNRSDPQYVTWSAGESLHEELLKCPKTHLWSMSSYHLPDSSHSDIVERKLVRFEKRKKKKDTKKDKAHDKNKTPAANLMDMLRALSSQLQNVGMKKEVVEDNDMVPVDDDIENPLGTCSYLEDPNRAMNREELTGVGENAAVELNIGALGSFSVNVFSDGFVINSQLVGNTMEISGIGQPSMFVKEYNSTHSSAVVAMQNGQIATCDVHVDVSWGPFQDGEKIWNAKNYDEQFLPEELYKKRSCSFAAFGPTSSYMTFPREVIRGPMKRLHSAESCEPPNESQSESEAPDRYKVSQNPVTSEDSPTWLTQWMKRAADGIGVDNNDGGGDEYKGSIVVADRGSCMFEQKTIAAERAGAEAVIIVNSEPALFMMAGLAHVDTDQSSGRVKTLSHIPTVMLMSTDGEYVSDAVEYLASKGISAGVSVDIVGLPAVIDSKLMGYAEHPTIRMSEKIIHIHGLGGWSALLSQNSDLQWQLFIVPSTDLSAITPWNILTTKGLPYCTNSDFSMNPVKSYLHLIRESCPSFIRVQNSKVVEIKK